MGLKNVKTGNTLCAQSDQIVLETMDFPEPVVAVSVEPVSKADQDSLSKSLSKLGEEDPTFKVSTDEETGQTIISGMGELHLEILVDRLLRGMPIKPDERKINNDGKLEILENKKYNNNIGVNDYPSEMNKKQENIAKNISVYPYGVNKGKLETASKEIGINVSIAHNLQDAEFIVTTKNFYKKRTKFLIEAHKSNIPLYVIRKNTLNQIVSLLSTLKKQSVQTLNLDDSALKEAEGTALELSQSDNISKLELSPQSAYIRKMQHNIAEKYGLTSASKDVGISRRVVYFKN